MQTKTIWIKSANAWTATESDPWISLSKSSGAANDPIGETISVSVTDNISILQRTGYISVTSAGQTKKVEITQKAGAGETFRLINNGVYLTNNGSQLINVR